MPWIVGNLHCHSTRSDGDSPPGELARFYRDHGFGFVAITDHDNRTGPEHCGDLGPDFTVLNACEYSASSVGRPLHINGIGAASAPAKPPGDDDPVATMQAGIDGFRAQGAFVVLNHPNWRWGWGLDELRKLRGAHAFEIWNGAPDSNNLGDEAHPGTEALWDAALSAGIRLWAVASDDCHCVGPRRTYRSDPPFSGWVAVEAGPTGGEAGIVAALKAGRFYASNGPRLERLSLDPSAVELQVEEWGATVQRTVFIGNGGRVLSSTTERLARYVPRGDEGYIRARVETAQGRCAWTQPLFLA